MQIKTTLSYHYPHTRLVKTKGPTTLNADEDVEQPKASYTVGGDVKQHNRFGESEEVFLYNQTSAILWPNVPRETQASVHQKTLQEDKKPFVCYKPSSPINS